MFAMVIAAIIAPTAALVLFAWQKKRNSGRKTAYVFNEPKISPFQHSKPTVSNRGLLIQGID